MGTPGPPRDATEEDVLSVFAQSDQQCALFTTAEIARELDWTRESARGKLSELAERGELRCKETESGDRVWWRLTDTGGSGERADGEVREGGTAEPREGSADEATSSAAGAQSGFEEFGDFVGAVEDYAIFTLDPDGNVANWNEGAERIKGYETEEILGEHFSTFYTDEAVDDGVPEENLELAASEGRVEDEGWRVREDGSRFWANVVITAIRSDDGTLRGFTKVTRDMTEQREYEQRLRRERDFTEQVLETVPISVCVMRPDGTFVRANRRVLDRLGVDESDLTELSAESWDLYDAEGSPIPADEWPLTRVVETGEPIYEYECQIDLPGIGRRWLSINFAPLAASEYEDELIVLTVDDTTERKRRERHLRRERDQTEQLLRTVPVAIAVQDGDGNTVMANQRAQEALGLSEREFVEDPDDADEWTLYGSNGDPLSPTETPTARVLATGEPLFDEDVTIETPRGERMQFRLNAAPLFGSDGTIERVIVAAEEITELKRRERQLERRKAELETELREVFDRVSDAFYALDEEWRFTHVNDRAAELVDRCPDELLGRSVWDVFENPIDGVYRERFEAAMEAQESVGFEVYEEAVGSWFEFSVYPSETGLSIYFRDVTDRKERERELAKYETIVETIHDGIYVKDEDDRFTMVNEAYAALTGYSREDLLGAHASLVVDEATVTRARERQEAMPDDGAADPTLEAMILTADGDRVPAEGTFATIETDGGEREHVGVVRDISDRKEYERRLEESNERLEQFAYAASHDLQEPLRMVTSYLQLIDRRYEDALDDDGREFLEFAVDGAERMRDMIDGLLDYSRVETKGDPFEPTDLNAVLADVRDDLQIQITERDAEITADPLPTVAGDRGQLRQVFQNLLDNAIEYSEDAPPRIHVGAERTDAAWVISVSDEGIGIDPDGANRVFEVFQRLHRQDEHPGTGIGLALCRRIVERHGGEIWVESEPGDGTTFSFTVPVREEEDA